jgi:RimJ/RimL family protein N-acetyltransferase
LKPSVASRPTTRLIPANSQSNLDRKVRPLELAAFTRHNLGGLGWRLAFGHWGHGYATEAARLALGYGFGTIVLLQIVSFTTATNRRSRAVMERLEMRRDPADDFEHPSLPESHPLRRHVLYRLNSGAYSGRNHCRVSTGIIGSSKF